MFPSVRQVVRTTVGERIVGLSPAAKTASKPFVAPAFGLTLIRDQPADGILRMDNQCPMTAQKPVVSGELLLAQLKRPRVEAPSAKAEGRRQRHR